MRSWTTIYIYFPEYLVTDDRSLQTSPTSSAVWTCIEVMLLKSRKNIMIFPWFCIKCQLYIPQNCNNCSFPFTDAQKTDTSGNIKLRYLLHISPDISPPSFKGFVCTCLSEKRANRKGRFPRKWEFSAPLSVTKYLVASVGIMKSNAYTLICHICFIGCATYRHSFATGWHRKSGGLSLQS